MVFCLINFFTSGFKIQSPKLRPLQTSPSQGETFSNLIMAETSIHDFEFKQRVLLDKEACAEPDSVKAEEVKSSGLIV